MGIALASAFAAWINTFLLFFILWKKGNVLPDSRLIKNGLKIIFCTTIMGGICFFLKRYVYYDLNLNTYLVNILLLVLVILCCISIYILLIFMLKVLNMKELKGFLQK